MEQAEALLKSGDLDGCLQVVMSQLRSDASAIKPRILLFQLYCVVGEWERARRQLYILKDMDAATIPMFESYDSIIQCEHVRRAVFAGERSPLVFGQPAEWTAKLAAALAALAAGRLSEASALRDAAFDEAPTVQGQIDGRHFEWLADADGRLGPLFEVFIKGNYYWVPMDCVASLRLSEPEDLRDLVWAPVELRWSNGGEAVGFMPARYPGSESADDTRLQLSRLTEWQEPVPELLIGLGQRLLLTDEDEYPLLGVRQIDINSDQIGPVDANDSV